MFRKGTHTLLEFSALCGSLWGQSATRPLAHVDHACLWTSDLRFAGGKRVLRIPAELGYGGRGAGCRGGKCPPV